MKTDFGDDRLPKRFWDKVVENKDTDCWKWVAAKASWRMGYGYYWHNHLVQRAHRVAYEVLVGEIPKGLGLDHLCCVTECVNPKHLEPTTQKENVHRGLHGLQTHCAQSHEFTEDNTYFNRNEDYRWKHCRECRRLRQRRYRERVDANV